MRTAPRIRAVTAADEPEWQDLYTGYRRFYRLPENARVVQDAWEWVVGEQHGLRGFVAADEAGKLRGLANTRLFARPSAGTLGVYVDGLFTNPAHRRRGVASALLRAVAEYAGDQDANVVRWITDGTNVAARSVYDRVGVATPWVTYDMRPTHGPTT